MSGMNTKGTSRIPGPTLPLQSGNNHMQTSTCLGAEGSVCGRLIAERTQRLGDK